MQKKVSRKFENIVADEQIKYMDLIFKDKNLIKILGERIKNHLFEEKIPPEGNDSLFPSNPRREFVSDIFKDYTEIYDSMENMKMVSVLIKQYPNYKIYKSQKITKTRYLRYHINNYLEEVYIFEKRLEILLNKTIKKLKSHKLLQEVKDIEKLKQLLYKTLEGIIATRGSHVHKKRFTNKEIDRMESLELYAGDKKFEVFGLYKDSLYRKNRNKWSKTINENNTALQKLLDKTFDDLKPIIFDKLILKYKETQLNTKS